jgi:predicted transcriptional regulator
MKAITINVSEPIYDRFKEYARSHDRTTSELIREAMEVYLRERVDAKSSIRDLRVRSAGAVLRPITRDGLSEELFNDRT